MSKVTKTYPVASFKKLDGTKSGAFEAVVSVFGNVDLQGDRVQPGAFTKSLSDWRAKGDPIPIIWSHDWSNPFAHIGYANPYEVEEIDGFASKQADGANGGLLIRGQLDIGKEFAAQVYDLLDERRVKEWSFAYDVIRESMAKDKANDLLEVALIEAGPTLKGANSETFTLGVKTATLLGERADREFRSISEDEQRVINLAKRADDFGDAELAMMVRAQVESEPKRPVSPDTSYAAPAGSAEKTRESLVSAVKEWNEAATLVGTYDSYVVVALEKAGEEPEALTLPYVVETDESITFGDPSPSEVEMKQVDTGAWDGAAAMASCSSAADYRRIAFERANDSDPDTAAHWALPHHSRPGADPNAAGVSAAVAALNGARGGAPALKDTGAARSHLEAHQTTINANKTEEDGHLEKAGRVIGAQRVTALKAAISDAIDSFVAEVNGSPDTGPAGEPTYPAASEKPEGAKDETTETIREDALRARIRLLEAS